MVIAAIGMSVVKDTVLKPCLLPQKPVSFTTANRVFYHGDRVSYHRNPCLLPQTTPLKTLRKPLYRKDNSHL
jgi:hypothetical protein